MWRAPSPHLALIPVALCGCAPSIQDIEARVLSTNVVEVTWTTRSDVSSHVAFGVDTLDLETLPDAGGTEHRALLVGLPQGSTGRFQVVAGDQVSDEQTVQTTTLVEQFPPFTLEGEPLDKFLVMPVYRIDGPGGVLVVDAEGRIVWQHLDNRGEYVTRAHLAPDGSGVVYNSSDLNGDPAVSQELVWVSWEGDEVRVEAVPLLGHDFAILADGTVATLAFEIRDGLKGNKIAHIAPDGTETVVWTSWDCFDPAVHTHDDLEMGWTFANAMDFDEATDSYAVSLRNFSAIAAIDGATGTCPWVFGDIGTTVSGAEFVHQHQFEILDGALVVFDNDGKQGNSRITEYAFDPASGTAEPSWSHELGQWNPVLGDVHRTDDGDTLVSWATHGYLEQLDPSGAVVSTLRAEPGLVIGFSSLTADPNRP